MKREKQKKRKKRHIIQNCDMISSEKTADWKSEEEVRMEKVVEEENKKERPIKTSTQEESKISEICISEENQQYLEKGARM